MERCSDAGAHTAPARVPLGLLAANNSGRIAVCNAAPTPDANPEPPGLPPRTATRASLASPPHPAESPSVGLSLSPLPETWVREPGAVRQPPPVVPSVLTALPPWAVLDYSRQRGGVRVANHRHTLRHRFSTVAMSPRFGRPSGAGARPVGLISRPRMALAAGTWRCVDVRGRSLAAFVQLPSEHSKWSGIVSLGEARVFGGCISHHSIIHRSRCILERGPSVDCGGSRAGVYCESIPGKRDWIYHYDKVNGMLDIKERLLLVAEGLDSHHLHRILPSIPILPRYLNFSAVDIFYTCITTQSHHRNQA